MINAALDGAITVITVDLVVTTTSEPASPSNVSIITAEGERVSVPRMHDLRRTSLSPIEPADKRARALHHSVSGKNGRGRTLDTGKGGQHVRAKQVHGRSLFLEQEPRARARATSMRGSRTRGESSFKVVQGHDPAKFAGIRGTILSKSESAHFHREAANSH